MSEWTNPFNLFKHYIYGTGQDVTIPIEDLNDVDWDVSKHRSFRSTLNQLKQKKSPHPTFVRFPEVLVAPNYWRNSDGFGIGRYVLDFQGNMTLKDDTWEFDGDVTGPQGKNYLDRYDFNLLKNEKERGWLGEKSTQLGNMFPGKPYNMKISGYRRYRQTGRF